MPLITSISGIRGTIGGPQGSGLSPIDLVHFVTAYASQVKEQSKRDFPMVVVGRDARTSGDMVSALVSGSLMSMGINVVDAGLTTTPTVEMAVIFEQADGGIIITASHNPAEWNALKFVDHQGEFISSERGEDLLVRAISNDRVYATADAMGRYAENDTFLAMHIGKILDLPLVDVRAIQAANLSVVVDAVNSSGGIAVPALLRALGVREIYELYCKPDGRFAHNPEPLPAHLKDLADKVVNLGADVGFAVDPDVDRLAIVCEDGSMFGEEYTLVAVGDYVLSHNPGPAVSNLSSTQALRDVAHKHKQEYFTAAVGEVNVVAEMKKRNAVIGGEGNGGVIYPALHYGRDALVGIALFLTHLAKKKQTCSELRQTYPDYFVSKNKINIPSGIDLNIAFEMIALRYPDQKKSVIDGLRIDFEEEWVHLRKSNTEPILRIYAESKSADRADRLSRQIIESFSTVVASM